ncbi:MAG: cobalt/nickel transport system ATP-binding protein [Nitrospirae bacterium]|nr:MAG: cobalt/nickel transport system ATP-binding protein [Nitrospirota bacterium]
MNLFSFDNVSFNYYQHIPALIDVSLTVGRGERFAVIGSNGSGKSTLLQICAGLLHPQQGCVMFDGEVLSEQSLKQETFRRSFRSRVGFIFQDSEVQLFCPTVLDELVFGPLQLGIDTEAATGRAHEIMHMLQIEQLSSRPTHMLSGGEKKRVALGCVLTMNPDVLLFDEPTNGLDPRTQVFLLELMLALNESGKTIIMATHDLGMVSEIQARVAVLSEEHRIECIGSAEEVLADEELLLRVNLVHEHVHFHGGQKHSHLHSHYLFHKH